MAEAKIPKIVKLAAEEVKIVVAKLATANQLAETLREVAFTNKWCKKQEPYSGVWMAHGVGYPIVGRFFLKHKGTDEIEGFVEQESLKNRIFGKFSKENSTFDLTIQWANGDMTHVGAQDSKEQLGRMNVHRTTLEFPYTHYRVIPGTSEYDETNNKGTLQRYLINAKNKKLFDKLLDNIYAISQLYENISLKRLANMFGLDLKSAELLTQCLLKCGQVTGAIDQEDQMIVFERQRDATKNFNAQVRNVCNLVQSVHDEIIEQKIASKT
mmetsp:Transcript_983/g.1402  ORF Transcript_983/g.1402 Transcript_983/m.1402 type:complete len:269 (-) Transcript_983:98-904(-)|eukprot:CAMPEP_0167745160 /NCGR_PEP_ID=MMETSP0110_2-20121227/2997_1 /TAXON_ID=629695 /ORGANISM="Gymnochlora sp., Strain CCMP2014" /LENGTH=268 /DNA_ID=CAMNT_0007629771 /DNA_START=44 /DNA_END=850 /DNA_ORIENTATION=-